MDADDCRNDDGCYLGEVRATFVDVCDENFYLSTDDDGWFTQLMQMT